MTEYKPDQAKDFYKITMLGFERGPTRKDPVPGVTSDKGYKEYHDGLLAQPTLSDRELIDKVSKHMQKAINKDIEKMLYHDQLLAQPTLSDRELIDRALIDRVLFGR